VSNTDLWKGAAEVEDILLRMGVGLSRLLSERRLADPLMVGIHTGGVWVAQRMHKALAIASPLAKLDISFYRDDFTRIGMHPQVHPSDLPETVEDRHVVLVDDVLQTGRTIRAALNVLFDYGRPASVVLVTLAERGGRELPIEPDVVGLKASLAPGQQVKLTGPEPLQLVIGQIPDHHRKQEDPPPPER
jgi:pyrimidine operon attenuation protein/uracil phosphoribosyltransferase